MANNHVRPGQSVTWRNVTGAPVRSGALVPFGGGVAAKALHDIPAEAEGEVTLHQVHRVPLPVGLSFSPGDLVYVQDGQISDSGDLLGRFIRLDQGGWAEVLIMPLTAGGGGGGGTSDIAWKPTVTPDGDISWTRTSSTTAPAPQNIKGPQGEKGDPGADGDAKVFVATYNVTTAQEIIAFLDAAQEPFAPVLVRRGNDYYTVFIAAKRNEESIYLRTFGTSGGEYYVFQYTVTGSVWASSSYGVQQKLQSGTSIKTVNGESLLGAGNVEVQTMPNYVLSENDTGGNVIQKGTIEIDGTTYGIYEFYYKTDELPNTGTKSYNFTNLLDQYIVKDFIDATGIVSNGVFIGNGRTDNDNRVIVQQFSKNSKTITIRAYQDFSLQTATLKVLFIGTQKNN